MNLLKDKKTRVSRARRWLALAIVFVLFAAGSTAIAFVTAYKEKIYPGVYIGPVNVSGLTPEEARQKLQQTTDAYLKKGLTFQSLERRVTIDPVIIATENPDLYYELASFNIEQTISRAYNLGHDDSLMRNAQEIFSALFSKTKLPVVFTLDRGQLTGILKQNFSQFEEPAQDAIWEISFPPDSRPQFAIKGEKQGRVFNYNEALRKLEASMGELSAVEITLNRQEATPSVTKEEVEALIPEAAKALSRTPIILAVGDVSWKINSEDAAPWLVVKKTTEKNSVDLDSDKLKTSLQEWGKKYNLEQEPQNAKFKFENGKVLEFQSSKNGVHISSEENIRAIREAVLLGTGEETLTLKTEITEPEFKTDEVNTFGIRELIGKATTSFAGSPKNRRYNIGVALEKLNGLIIKQGEDFSLTRAIGNVDAEAGFKEELVIKGDKTIPEFGGGLCQIATTIFRSALASGLEILERQNHSYRVPYYEPPVGMDATIYQPKPDLVFKNNTDAGILILGKISGNNLTFEFWGKSDGREAKNSAPVVTNIVAPPPTRLIPTTELPVGAKKCTEKAHVGSDASFIYTVSFPDGRKEEKIFKSHYRPWQEVCLMGAMPEMASSTEHAAGAQ